MKVPELAKRYKVFWTYYISTIRKHHKTFENIDKKTARLWLNKLLWHPITASVQVSDEKGNFKVFENETTMDVLRKREAFFTKLTEEFGGGEEGQQKAQKYLRQQGDWAISALPVQVRAWILAMKRKKSQERQDKLNEEGR